MALGPTQIVIIGVLIIVLFGARRLASLGTGLGEGIRNFKKGLTGVEDAARIDASNRKS